MKINQSDRVAFDRAGSVRWVDKDGRLHVKRSNFTRVQIAPYRGDEIPDWEKRGLDPEKIYHAYRPAEELSKPETVRSIEGIPIQLRHNLDFPDSPAKKTRVGSTGDLASFEFPYLTNSLHLHDQKAIDLVNDGLMRELSLCYHYDPDFTAGETDDGKKYDFVMRNIRGQHLALVEEGRAGASCCVADSAEKVKNSKISPPEKSGVFYAPDEAKTKEGSAMDEDDKITGEPVNDLTVSELLELAKYGKEQKEKESEALDEEDDEIADDEDEAEDTDDGEEFDEEEETEIYEDRPVDEDDKAEDDEEELDDDNAEDEEDDEAKDEDEEKDEAEDDEGEPEQEEAPKFTEKSLKESLDWIAKKADEGMPALIQYGFRMMANSLAGDIKKNSAKDSEKDGKGESVATDSALNIRRRLEKRVERKAQALEVCRPILGRVKLSAFDSAGDVYFSALKQLGKCPKGLSPKNARVVFEALQTETRNRRKSLASDSKRKAQAKRDPLLATLSKIKVNR